MSLLENFFLGLGLPDLLSNVVAYFIVTSINILLLLSAGIFVFSYIRARFLDEDLVKRFESKPKIVVYLGMALLGIISPFCSCSTIPAFVTFASLGVPTGALFVYLITSPLIQEASLILLITQFGLPVAILYVVFGVVTGLLAGWLISKMKDHHIFKNPERFKKAEAVSETSCCDAKPAKETNCCGAETVKETSCCGAEAVKETSCCGAVAVKETNCCGAETVKETSCCGAEAVKETNCCGSETVKETSCCDTKATNETSCCDSTSKKAIVPKEEPVRFAVEEVKKTFKSTYKYVLLGIGFGAFIHGMVPQSLIEQLLGSSNQFAPIFATVSGIPLYADDVALIPIAKSLIDKGAGLGTAISFVMASAVVSLPSFILLGSVLKKEMLVKIAIFLTIAIIIIGYLFNFLQFMIM